MFHDSVCTAVRVQVAAIAHSHIIVHLKVFYSVIPDQPVYGIHTIFTYFRIPEVQKIPLVIYVTFSMSADKPVVRKFLSQFTGSSHDLDFQPKAHFHTLALGIITDSLQTIWKTFRRFFPFSYSVPPVAFVIPAAVQAVVFTAHFRSLIYNGSFPFIGRVSHKTVHIIVQYHIQFLIIFIFSSNCSAVLSKRCSALADILLCCSKGHRNCSKRLSWLQILPPSLLRLSRSFFADSSYMLSFSVLCSCVCSRLISPSVSSWHKQDNTLMHQSPGHIQRRTPYNF